MIVRQDNDCFILISQDHHARLAGALAEQWGNESFNRLDHYLKTAIDLHDFGWVGLDSDPRWNEEKGVPYSFLDEPLERRIPAYRMGIDYAVEQDAYAGLLCSLHYTSFYPARVAVELGPIVESFVADETLRQADLMRQVEPLKTKQDVEHDLGVLKLLDNLSLYACLNAPGAAKADEHPWYRQGFAATPVKVAGGGIETVRFTSGWKDDHLIVLDPFPFAGPAHTEIEFRKVARDNVSDHGYAQAAARTPWETLALTWFHV
ncbi:MAG: DUF3891 family protein [Anaerolineales bacterium]|nr:DUF3891 family protein [Anaerolineales bacterium]